jgi:GrpB-like predicted nucleotidyltransferase (UPF0157 family)
VSGIDHADGNTLPGEDKTTPEQVLFVPMTEEQIRAANVGVPTPLSGPILLAEYDPMWPHLFAYEARRVREILGERVLLLEHVGSTSVPGLAAKPRIDMLLVIADSADEPAYVPAMEAAGYVLKIREPDWYQHRMFNGPERDINLHVFSAGCPEIDRMILFRDWLRSHVADRQLYERTKRDLASRNWKYIQNYADAKTAVVQDIFARAQGNTEEKRSIDRSSGPIDLPPEQ